MLTDLEHMIQGQLDDTHQQSMHHQQLDPNSVQEIERRYQNRSGRLKEYRFPRKKQSLASSICSQSLQQPTYDLLSQNKKYLHEQFEALVALEESHMQANMRKQKQRNEDHIHILNVREIRKMAGVSSRKPQSKMKITSNKKSPQPANKTKQIFPRARQRMNIVLSLSHTPQKDTAQTKQKSRKKLMVLSSNKKPIHIEEFDYRESRSPRKGLQVVSKEKSKGEQKGRSIQRKR